MKGEPWGSRPTDLAAVIGFAIVGVIVSMIALVFVMVFIVNYILLQFQVTPM